jgi:hypothetical protein
MLLAETLGTMSQIGRGGLSPVAGVSMPWKLLNKRKPHFRNLAPWSFVF